MMELTAERLVEQLVLSRHPEGGWFRESYRCTESIPKEGLPQGFGGSRSVCTGIYFLLQRGEISALHRIKSDELWHFYAGTGLTIQVITRSGEHLELKLGRDLDAGESFQAMVPAGCWFGAEVSGAGEYALVGCTVAPGFDFADFEMGKRGELLRDFPDMEEVIVRLTAPAS
jgi:uncharacterized protein